MLSKPQHGWTSFTIGDFKGDASYLTDVPMDLLDFFLGKTNIIYFDEEGSEFALIRAIYSLSILHEGKKKTFYDLFQYKEEDLAKELFIDLKEHFNDWIYWNIEYGDVEANYRFILLSHKLRRLKEKYQIE